MLTKDDIKAMKAADRVSFHAYEERKEIEMRLIKRISVGLIPGSEHTDIEVDHTLTFPVVFHTYGALKNADAYLHAFFYMPHLWADGNWQALLALIRPNDALHFTVVVGNDSISMQESGITRDSLTLAIKRGDKTLYSGFSLAEEVGKTLSSARAVQSGNKKAA